MVANWRMANWAAHNAPALNIAEVIFYDRIWSASKGGWRAYKHSSSTSAATARNNTLQHRDHVHLSVF